MERIDAVVVGAGHNGLVAANLLADAGWSVVVLEATDRPGGAVRSAQITAPGFLSDLCSAFYPLGFVSPVLRRLELAEHGLRWRNAPAPLAHVLPDGRTALVEHDPAMTAAGLERFAPGDGQRWLDAYAEWEQVGPGLIAALLDPFPPVRAGLRLVRQLRPGGTLRLARQMLLPARRLSTAMFAGDGARVLLAGCTSHTDLSLDDATSGVYGWLLVMLAQQHGFPVAEGGAQRLTDALIARLAGRGGEVRCRSAVRRIVTRGGRAVGVVTEAGEAWRAGRAVVADVPAPLLYRDLVGLDRLPASLAADLEYFTWDNATVKLDWALSGPVPWREPAVARAGTVHLGVDLDGMSQYTTDLACGRIPGQPFVLCGQMTTADPSRSPPGTEVVWAYSHLPRRRSWSAGEIDEHAAVIQQTIEDQAPGFASRVIARTVTGPDQLFAENPSLPGGSIVGGTMAAYQQLVLRPTPGLGRADTPFDRLYLASASNHPGGAVHGAAGANAARAALARDRPVLGTVYGAGMKAVHRAIHSGQKKEDRPWPLPVSS